MFRCGLNMALPSQAKSHSHEWAEARVHHLRAAEISFHLCTALQLSDGNLDLLGAPSPWETVAPNGILKTHSGPELNEVDEAVANPLLVSPVHWEVEKVIGPSKTQRIHSPQYFLCAAAARDVPDHDRVEVLQV